MDFILKITEEEKQIVIAAIKELNALQHVKTMSQAMIANSAGMKVTKVRNVLQELVDEGAVTQYAATENPKLQRYYYCVKAVEHTPDQGCAVITE